MSSLKPDSSGLFQLDRPAPTEKQINDERALTAELVANVRGVVSVTLAIALGQLVFNIYRRQLLTDAIGLLVISTALIVAFLMRLYLARLSGWAQLLLPVAASAASPPRLRKAFSLTNDTRRYGEEVLAQGRPVTFAELRLVELYAVEFEALMKQLAPDQRLELVNRVGFDLGVPPAPAPQ